MRRREREARGGHRTLKAECGAGRGAKDGEDVEDGAERAVLAARAPTSQQTEQQGAAPSSCSNC